MGLFRPSYRTFYLSFSSFSEVFVSPFLQPSKVPLNGCLHLHHRNHSPRFCVIRELDEIAFQRVVQVIDEDIKKYQPQRKATHNQLQLRLLTTDHYHFTPIVQPLCSPPIQSMSLKCGYDTVQRCKKPCLSQGRKCTLLFQFSAGSIIFS